MEEAGNDASTSDGGAWTPAQLSGLSLWLDDTVGVVIDPVHAGRIKRWLDQSGKGNNAEGTGGDGVTMSPTLDPAALGGKDVIACDLQTILTVPSVDSLKFGTGDFGIVMVAKVAASSTLYAKDSLFLQVTAGRDLRLDTNTSGAYAVLADTPVDKFEYFVARGAAIRVQSDGKTATGATVTTEATNGNGPLTLCQSSISTTVSLAEVIVVKGTLSDADLTKTLGYLTTKFGL